MENANIVGAAINQVRQDAPTAKQLKDINSGSPILLSEFHEERGSSFVNAHISPEEAIALFKEKKYDKIVVTDHGTYVSVDGIFVKKEQPASSKPWLWGSKDED